MFSGSYEPPLSGSVMWLEEATLMEQPVGRQLLSASDGATVFLATHLGNACVMQSSQARRWLLNRHTKHIGAPLQKISLRCIRNGSLMLDFHPS
jgi:hypothetical protein